MGLEARTITQVPDDFLHFSYISNLHDSSDERSLLAGSGMVKRLGLEDMGVQEARKELRVPKPWREESLATAWSSKDFGIYTTEAARTDYLSDIYDALVNKRAALWVGGRTAFSNTGLFLVDVASVSEQHRELFLQNDCERVRLLEAARSTGVKELIDESDRGYYALKPKFYEGDLNPQGRTLETDHPVVSFLNPWDQKISESGWFTVEELQRWARGEDSPIRSF